MIPGTGLISPLTMPDAAQGDSCQDFCGSFNLFCVAAWFGTSDSCAPVHMAERLSCDQSLVRTNGRVCSCVRKGVGVLSSSVSQPIMNRLEALALNPVDAGNHLDDILFSLAIPLTFAGDPGFRYCAAREPLFNLRLGRLW